MSVADSTNGLRAGGMAGGPLRPWPQGSAWDRESGQSGHMEARAGRCAVGLYAGVLGRQAGKPGAGGAGPVG
jgi:hypothetical protein